MRPLPLLLMLLMFAIDIQHETVFRHILLLLFFYYFMCSVDVIFSVSLLFQVSVGVKMRTSLFIHASIFSAFCTQNIRILIHFDTFRRNVRPNERDRENQRGGKKKRKGFSCSNTWNEWGVGESNGRGWCQSNRFLVVHATHRIKYHQPKKFFHRKRFLIKNCIFRSCAALWSFP